MSRDKDTFLSKTLSWLLRHSAVEENLPVSPDGFVPVSEIINHRSLKGKCTFSDVQRVVENNEKQRFSLRTREGVWEIRANQGHSLSSVQDLQLEPLTDASSIKNVIHGTYFKNLAQIQREGLSRMNRNHIHFSHDLPGSKNVISGIRKSAQVFVYIDLAKALSEGIKFYKSSNGVILSPGDRWHSNYETMNYAKSNKIYCKICKKYILGSPKNFESHCSGKKHIQKLPFSIIVKAPFPADKAGDIEEYFKQFGNIIHTNVTALEDTLQIIYQFEDRKAYTKIVHQEHKIAGKELEIILSKSKAKFQNLIVVTPRVALFKQEKPPGEVGIVENTPEVPTKPVKRESIQQRLQKEKMDASQDGDVVSLLNAIKEGKTFVDQVIILQQKLQAGDRAELDKNRKMILSDLTQALAPVFPLHQVHVFGSSVTGLDFKGGDLDVYVANVRQKTKPEVLTLKTIRTLIYKSKKFCDLLLIPAATVPIIKCIHTRTQICCDLNIRNRLPVANSELIKYYLTLDEKLRPLMITIKFWMEYLSLKKTTLFSGYAVYLLIIFYLQVEYDLPTVEDLQKDFPADIEDNWNCAFKQLEDYDNTDLREETLLGLVTGFFKFYSNFDYVTNVICPFYGKPIKKVSFMVPYNLPDSYKTYEILDRKIPLNSGINIQDPFEHCRNISYSVPLVHVGRFTALCRSAHQLTKSNEPQLLSRLLLHCAGPHIKKHSFIIKNSRNDSNENSAKEWFESVKEITMQGLKTILMCEVNPLFSVVPNEAMNYDCQVNKNIWLYRFNVVRGVHNQLSSVTDFVREVAVSAAMLQNTPRLGTKFRLTLCLKRNPWRIEAMVQSLNKCKMFNFVSDFLQIKLTQWVSEMKEKTESGESAPVSAENPEMIVKEDSINDENNANSDNQVNSSIDEKPPLGEDQAPEPDVKGEKAPEDDAQKPLDTPKSEEDGEIPNEDDGIEEEDEVEEDVPPDFFDAFSNQDFMDGLDIIDAWDDESGPGPEEDSGKVSSAESQIKSPEKRKKHRSRSPQRRRKRSRSRDKNMRRDPEKTKRDIHRDKIKCAKDKEQKLVSEKLKIVETGLVPPGTEMESDIAAITNENKKHSSVEKNRKYSSRRSNSKETRKKYSRSPLYRSRNRESHRRRRTSSVDSNLSEREQWIRSTRKRTRSRSRTRDSPLRIKSRKHEEKQKKKSFLEEISEKLNEVHPTPLIHYNHPMMPQFPNPIPAPVPAPSQFFQPAQTNPGMQQYDQRFFIGDAYPMNVSFNNPMNNTGNVVSVPQVQMTPQPQVQQQQQVSVHPITNLPIVQTARVSPNIQNEATAKAPENVDKHSTDDIDKLFADKKISLSDFLTITAKCEVQSSSPEHLQKKIKVISRCQDAIKAMSDDRKFTGRLLVRPSSEPKNKQEMKFQSPLRRIPIVRFQFTSPAKVSEEVDSFASALDKVLQKIGVLKETIDLAETAEGVVKSVAGSTYADEDSLALSLKASLLNCKGSTDVVGCEECRKRKLKQFAEVGSQCVDNKETVSIGTQVTEEDITPNKGLLKGSIAYLTPAQLLNKEKEKEKEKESTPTPSPSETKTEKKKIDAPETKPEITEKPKIPFNKGRGGFRGNKSLRRSFNNSFNDEFEFFGRGRPSLFESPRELFAARFGPGTPPVHYPRHNMFDDDQQGIGVHQLRDNDGSLFTDFNQPYRGRNPRFGHRF